MDESYSSLSWPAKLPFLAPSCISSLAILTLAYNHQMKTATLVVLLTFFPPLIPSKFVNESCNAFDACPSLLAFLLPHDSKLSEIASKFEVNVTDLVGANAFNAAKSFSGNEILPENTLLRIPFSCPCDDGGIRRSRPTAYTVKAVDTIDSITAEFNGLVSAEQIQTANGIWGPGGLQIGRSLVIPLPCACFNNSDNGVPAIYMSYVVREGDSLRSIGEVYGTTVSDLVAVNGLGTQFVYPGDILAIPIPACSSSDLNLQYSENLLVPNGSYALTALSCVQCTCGPKDLTLHCHPAPLAMSCSNFKCDSNLLIGDTYVQPTSGGCNVISCLYVGHKGHTILNRLKNSSQIQCSGAGRQNALPPSSLPSINQSIFPLSPSSAPPKPAATLPLSTISSGTNSIQDSGASLPAEASKFGFYLAILLVELILAACLKAI